MDTLAINMAAIFEENGFYYAKRASYSGYTKRCQLSQAGFESLAVDYLHKKLYIYTFNSNGFPAWKTIYLGFCENVIEFQTIITKLHLTKHFPKL